jgi:transitional endoplasmic reticulum ATPase
MRAEQFAIAIEEQRERYAVQEKAEDAIMRKESGRQRLLDMAANLDQKGKKPLRGFRLWLARLFGLV